MAQCPRQGLAFFGCEKLANSKAGLTGHERQPADQFALMIFVKLHPHPAPDKAALFGRVSSVQSVEHEFVLGDADAFTLAGIGKIGAEGPPDDEYVETSKARDRPRTNGCEYYSHHKIDADDETHDNQKTLLRQAAMWCQYGLPWFGVASIHAGDLPLKLQMNGVFMAKASRFKPAEVEELFRRFQAVNPEPKGELYFVNHYTLLVAVVLSAQATDEGVNRATKRLFAIADTPQKMVGLGEETVRDYIKTIGLFRGKAKNVVALSQRLIELHGGKVPDSREALEALPGVGRKTANVVLNVAFGHSTIAVDTHLFRFGNRTGLAPGKTPHEVEMKLLKAVPAAYGRHAHHWLILHGRYVCKARKPECWRCPIADLCRFKQKSPSPS